MHVTRQGTYAASSELAESKNSIKYASRCLVFATMFAILFFLKVANIINMNF